MLLMLAGVGNVLAEGMNAAAPGLYIGLPVLGGRLVTPGAAGSATGPGPVTPGTDHSAPLSRAVQRLTLTTTENAADLEAAREASASAGSEMDPERQTDAQPPGGIVVLTETHYEGRVHTVRVHPEDLDASLPVDLGRPHHDGGRGRVRPWGAA